MNMKQTTVWQNVAAELLLIAYIMLPIAWYFLH
jgi:maltodextrin utilization protein YvdJ